MENTHNEIVNMIETDVEAYTEARPEGLDRLLRAIEAMDAREEEEDEDRFDFALQ